MSGRAIATLAKIASGINHEYEWEIYSKKTPPAPPQSYSYSLETREFYFGENAEHRKRVLDLYGDGSSPLYMIAVKDVYNSPLDYDDVAVEMGQLVKSVHVPFIGCWYIAGDVYMGVSILANHGVSGGKVLAMLEDYGQLYAAKITLDGMTYFPPE